MVKQELLSKEKEDPMVKPGLLAKDKLIERIKKETTSMINNKNHKFVSVYGDKPNTNLWELYKLYAEKYPITQIQNLRSINFYTME